MELRRAADALVRVQSSPLASMLNPSSNVRWTTGRQLGCRSSISCQSIRSLSTTSQRPAIRPLPTTSSTPPPPTPTGSPSTSTAASPSSPQPPPKAPSDLTSIAAGLGWSDPSRLTPPPRRPFQPPAWRTSSLSSTQEQRFNGGNSASDILSALNATREAKRRSIRDPSSSKFNVSDMMAPFGPGDDMMKTSREVEALIRAPKTVRVPIHLGPSTGRSVSIGARVDVGRGFKLLEQSCARNRVKMDANTQRFHERPGLKRKRLRRQRWRRKFMEGFKATVGRVKQLKNQGW